MSGLVGYEEDMFAKQFERELKAAKAKAGRKVGGLIVRKRRKALGNVSSRRKKAVRAITARSDGTLVVLDHAPLAVAQEYGKVIQPKNGGKLLVRKGHDAEEGEKAFKSRDGKYLFAARKGQKKRLIGTYKNSVVIPSIPHAGRLSIIAEKYADKYAEEIEQNLFN